MQQGHGHGDNGNSEGIFRGLNQSSEGNRRVNNDGKYRTITGGT